jgi:hypothetical protein
MYVRAVPIVKDSVAMRSFESLGLPVWILPRWEDLLTLTEDDLEVKYEQLRLRFEAPALWMPFWKSLIMAPGGAARRLAAERMAATSEFKPGRSAR